MFYSIYSLSSLLKATDNMLLVWNRRNQHTYNRTPFKVLLQYVHYDAVLIKGFVSRCLTGLKRKSFLKNADLACKFFFCNCFVVAVF